MAKWREWGLKSTTIINFSLHYKESLIPAKDSRSCENESKGGSYTNITNHFCS